MRPFDGRSGLACARYNTAANLSWSNPGGDWVDAKGVSQGISAFAAADLRPGQTGKFSMDVTPIGPEIMLRFEGAPVSIHSREAPDGPVLIVTRADGSTTRLRAFADATMVNTFADATGKRKCASLTPTGQNATLQQAGAVIAFDAPPGGYRKLELELTLVKAFGAMTIKAFKLTRPTSPMAPVTLGLSRQYPNDRGICQDRRVLYCETWDREGGNAPTDWWRNSKGTYVIHQPSAWSRTVNGVTFPSDWTEVFYEPKAGVAGTGGLRVHYAPDHIWGTVVPSFDLVKAGMGEQQHLFYRYYVKYDKNFFDSMPCDGGKRPGFAADNTFGGNGGSRVWGFNGWSLRGHYALICDRDNPTWQRLILGTYAYHARQTGSYGDIWPWTGRGDQGLQKLDQWVCVEGETRVNDPGVPNGVNRGWLDARLVHERTDLYLRGPRPPQGYGNWQVPANAAQEEKWMLAGFPTLYDAYLKLTQYLVEGERKVLKNSDLAIRKFWGTIAHGGTSPFGKPADLYYDQTIVATERIGCIASEP